jgi:hypothetical protein
MGAFAMSLFRSHTEDAVDLIDAALFSGDEFTDCAVREELREVMARWSRRLEALESIDRDNEGAPE